MGVHLFNPVLVGRQRQEDPLHLTGQPSQLNLRDPVSKTNVESKRGRHPALSSGLLIYMNTYKLYTKRVRIPRSDPDPAFSLAAANPCVPQR